MDDSSPPTCSSSTAREEERLEKVLREGTFRDSLVMAKVIDTHPSSDSDSDEATASNNRARPEGSRPQCEQKDNTDEKPRLLGSGGSPKTSDEGDKVVTSDRDRSEGDASVGNRCSEDKQKSKRDPNVSSSEASTTGEAIPVSEVSQEDKKAEKAGGLKQGSPSSGESESSVGSSSESGSESDHNRSNDGANGAGPDDRNQVFITIETPLFEEDKDDSDAGPSTTDPSVGKQEDAGPSKRKYSSDSESESEGKTPPSYKRQKRESDSEEIPAAERLQRGFSAVSKNVVKDPDTSDSDDKERTVDHKKGRSETKTEKEKQLIQRPSGYNVDNMEEQKDSSKAATLKRPLEDDDSRQESPKRRRQSSGPITGPTPLADATCKEESEAGTSKRTDKPKMSGEDDDARPTPQDRAEVGDQASPTPRRRRSFTERYYEDAPILPAAPPAPTPPRPLGPPWNMYDPRNPESSSIRGTKKERYNLRIAQAMVDNAINTVLQELGFSPGNTRRKRRRRRERERQQAMEEAGVSSAIRSQGLSMGPHGGRTTTTSPGCPHHRRTSELNAGAGPSSASLPVPENEDEFERLAVSEAISQAGLSKSEESKDDSKSKDKDSK
ncbi:hypothetical protein Bbelb_142110 [Branchiostoma belcheri]|nr:hypothetical protein Bbelb_142110 [Branchiostoma belcheri]